VSSPSWPISASVAGLISIVIRITLGGNQGGAL
jgi:hypothetical protein